MLMQSLTVRSAGFLATAVLMITSCPASLAISSAVSASKYTWPTAAPGEALTPAAYKRPSCFAWN